jgi:DNA modification methylase
MMRPNLSTLDWRLLSFAFGQGRQALFRVIPRDKRQPTLDTIKHDPRNARKHTPRNVGMIESSIQRDGFGRSILLANDGTVIAGNATMDAAASAGLDDVLVIETDGTKVIAVKRTDVAPGSKEFHNLALADNRAAELAEWDPSVLAELQDEMDLSQFFGDDELAKLLSSVTKDGLTNPDDVPTVTEATTKPGDLWLLGRHRLLCGDSTVATDVERLMGGERPELLATDPPYNVGITYGEDVDDSKSKEQYETFTRDWFSLWSMECERQIVTPGCNNLASWLRWFDPYHVAPWTKTNAMTNGKVARWWCWEPVLFFGEKWGRERANDVFDFPVPPQTAKGLGSLSGLHPCPKPLGMWADLFTHYSKPGAIVADAFGGSGTAYIAAEQLNRTCYGMEIDPHYCDVIVKRWEQFAGQTATLESLAMAAD